MTRLAVFALGASACSSPVARTPARADGPCDLVEAMMAIDDPGYQSMYAGTHCGDGASQQPQFVIVHAPPEIFPPATSCPSRRFRVFHGETDVVHLIVQLDVIPDGDAWSFMASTVQPNMRPSPDGGFDVDETYCHEVAGYVRLRDHQWRAFVDNERWSRRH